MNTNNIRTDFVLNVCGRKILGKKNVTQISFPVWYRWAMLQELLSLNFSFAAYFWHKYLVKQNLFYKIWKLIVAISYEFLSCFLTEAELCSLLQDRIFTALNCQTFLSKIIEKFLVNVLKTHLRLSGRVISPNNNTLPLEGYKPLQTKSSKCVFYTYS